MSTYSDGNSPHSSIPPSAQPYRSLFGGSSQDFPSQGRFSQFGGDGNLNYPNVGGGPKFEDEDSAGDPDYVQSDEEVAESLNSFDSALSLLPKSEDTHAKPIPITRDPESSSSPPAYRPNKFHGPADEWLKLTRDDRDIVQALEETCARDLAAHLYNAHVLQSQGIGTLQTEYTGCQDENEIRGNEPGDPNVRDILEEWTAWPMPSDEVPRMDERLRRLEDDMWTFRMKPDMRPSADLEESIIAFLLKTANNRFRSRRWDSPSSPKWEDSALPDTDREWKSEQQSVELSLHSIAGADNGVSQSSAHQSDADDRIPKTGWKNGRDSLRFLPRPAFQVDDDESRRKLRPLARNVITQFEQLLIGLHRFHGPSGTDRPGRNQSRGRKRARSFSWTSDTSSAYSRNASIENASEVECGTHLHKDYSRSPSSEKKETMSQLDRSRSRGRKTHIRKKSRPSRLSSDRNESASTSRHSRSRLTSADCDFRSGLTDWTEVACIASMVGLPPAVLQRATQRFSALLCEDMIPAIAPEDPDREYMYFDDMLKLASTENNPAELKRDDSPSLPKLASQSPRSLTSSTGNRSPFPTDRTSPNPTDKAIASRANSAHKERSLVCPLEKCPRHIKGFSRRWNLNQHLKTMHPGYNRKEAKMRTRSAGQSGYDSYTSG